MLPTAATSLVPRENSVEMTSACNGAEQHRSVKQKVKYEQADRTVRTPQREQIESTDTIDRTSQQDATTCPNCQYSCKINKLETFTRTEICETFHPQST